MEENYNTCFIICMYYQRKCPSYIKINVDNILRLYKKSSVVLVSNNQENIIDIYKTFKDYENLVILENNSNSKYELGAFTFGIKWIIENNKVNNFNYYIFLQENLIPMNKYNLNILFNNNILACSIVEYSKNSQIDPITGTIYLDKERREILEPLGLCDNLDKVTLCWGCNFICNSIKIINLYNLIKDIVLKNKKDSEVAERYMARIIFELNNHSNFNIDGFLENYRNKGYDDNEVPFSRQNNDVFFVKKHQFRL